MLKDSRASFTKAEDTRAEITYLPYGSSTPFTETEARYFVDSDKPPEREISLSYVLDILRRRRRIVMWVMAFSFCAGLVLALRPRTYEASGTLDLGPVLLMRISRRQTTRRLIPTRMIGSSLKC